MCAARQTLFDIARCKDDRPFCLVVSMTHPHDPYTIPRQYWHRYDGAKIDMPRVLIPVDGLDPHSQACRPCEWPRPADADRGAGACRALRPAPLAGAGGLGVPIVRALNTIQVGAGFEADIAIVLLAVIPDSATRACSPDEQR